MTLSYKKLHNMELKQCLFKGKVRVLSEIPYLVERVKFILFLFQGVASQYETLFTMLALVSLMVSFRVPVVSILYNMVW